MTFVRPNCPPDSEIKMQPFYLFMIYTTILVIGYIRVFMIVRKEQQQMQSSFFRLFQLQIVVSVASLVTAFEENIHRANILCELLADWFTEPTLLFTNSFIFPLYYFTAVSGVVNVIISFNRLNSVHAPLTYNKWWHQHSRRVIAAAFFIALLPNINIAVSPAHLSNRVPNTTTMYIALIPTLPIDSLILMSVFSALLAIVIFISTIVTVVKLSRIEMHGIAKVERRTIGYGIVNSFGLLGITSAQVCMFYFFKINPVSPYASYVMDIRFYMSIPNFTTPLLAILWFCPDIKRKVFGLKDHGMKVSHIGTLPPRLY